MQFAFSSNAFTNFSLIDSISHIAQIGYQGIEIMCDKPHAYPPDVDHESILKIKSSLSSNNVKISNLNAFTLFALGDTYHPSWIDINPENRKARINHTKNCIELASQLGAKTISLEPGGPIDSATAPAIADASSSQDRLKLYNIFADGLKEVIPLAEKNRVKLLVEPEPGLLLQTSKEFLEFMKNFDSEFLKLNFDIGHFYCVREDPVTLINELYDYIEHFHLADIKDHVHNHLIPGLGDIQIKDILLDIKDSNYRGFVTIELYPYKNDPIGAAAQSLQYVKTLVS